MAAERFSAKFSPRSFCEFTQTAWDIFSCQIGHFQLCIIIGSSFVFVIGMHDVSLFFQLAEITATTVENGDVTLFAGSGAISSCDSSGFNFFLQIGEEALLCYLVVTCRNSTNSRYRGKISGRKARFSFQNSDLWSLKGFLENWGCASSGWGFFVRMNELFRAHDSTLIENSSD